MAQLQMENLSRIFHVPAGATGLAGSPDARMSFPLPAQNTAEPPRCPLHRSARAAKGIITRVLPSAFFAYYPTLQLVDKMTMLPLLNFSAPRTGLAAAARVRRRCRGSRRGTGS